MRTDNLYAVPADLPAPQDDGACDHLRGIELPTMELRATSGGTVDPSKEGSPWLPTFRASTTQLIKRLTLIARAGRIEEVFYPVFPPDADAARVIK